MMVVRTQDKKMIARVSNAVAAGFSVKAQWGNSSFGTIGIYDTPERAVEVVDLMHRFLNGAELQHVQRVFQMPER